MSSACGACTNDIFIARDCSFRLAISAKHATCVARDLPWKLRSLSADLLGAMLLLPSAPGGLTRAIASAAAVHVRSDRGACRGSPVGSRDQVNNSFRPAAPTGLIRYRSIPASRASSRPGCSLLTVNAISLRVCSCGC